MKKNILRKPYMDVPRYKSASIKGASSMPLKKVAIMPIIIIY